MQVYRDDIINVIWNLAASANGYGVNYEKATGHLNFLYQYHQ